MFFPFLELHYLRKGPASPDLVEKPFFSFIDFFCSSCQFVGSFRGNYYNSTFITYYVITRLDGLATTGNLSIDFS